MLFDNQRIEQIKAYIAQEVAGKARYFEVNERFPERFWTALTSEFRIFDLLVVDESPDCGLRTFLEIVRLVSAEFASLGSLLAAQGIYGIWAVKTFGNLEQQKNYLPQWLSGQELVAFAFSEKDVDLTHKPPQTIARQTAQGWQLTGHKHMVSNAGLAKQVLVLAQTVDRYGEKGQGIFVVDTQTAGVTWGQALDKDGLRAMPLAPISFDQVSLPEEALLGDRLLGQDQYQAIMVKMRLTISAQSLGIAEGVFTKGLADSKLKRGFGKRSIDVQVNQFKFAELEAQLVASQAYYETVIRSDFSDERQVSLLKLLTAQLAKTLAEEVVRITGIYSFIADNDIERYVRDAQVVAHYGGSSESLKRGIARAWLVDEGDD